MSKSPGQTRICAHRGLSEACPENTLPAFAAALACGADELELDLWLSHDGVPVVCHDPTVDRTCNGHGRLCDMPWVAIHGLDAGVKHSLAWRGVRVPRLEEVLDLVNRPVALNLHLKEPGPNGQLVKSVASLLRQRGLMNAAYMAGDEAVLQASLAHAPDLARACLQSQHQPSELLRCALKYQCQRLQFSRHHVTPELIQQAHKAGLICNLFWSDETPDALDFARQGIDVILSNRAHQLLSDGVGLPVSLPA
jgi:glycerophosphoryl diester phosphodiesterase